MSAYKTSLDIINRALQHMRQRRIATTADMSANALETNFNYDKLREAELRQNFWRFAIRRSVLRAVDASTLLWTPPTYSAATTYALGAVVIDANGDWWQSKIASNTGNTPAQGSKWAHYFGPDSMDPYVAKGTSDTAPAAPTLSAVAGGSLGLATYYVVITYVGADGETLKSSESSLQVAANNLLQVASPAAETGMTGYNVYVSNTSGTETLQNANAINIGTAWTLPTTGVIFGRQPPPSSIPTYQAGELTSLNGTVYLSLVGNNTDTPPTPNWLNVGGTTTQLQVLYPIGVGPSNDISTANYYRLPHGFLRQAPSDPKRGVRNYLGAPSGVVPDDWVFENDYIVSTDAGPIMLRFVADVVDVPDMDAMFCEMLSARVAEETAPTLADEKVLPIILGVVRTHYKSERFKAAQVNAIEEGPITPVENAYVTCRV